jgi:predicted phage terminase large subunit-like protein
MSNELDHSIRTYLLAFAMKAFAQSQGKQLTAPHPYLRFVSWHLEQVAEGEIKRLVVTLPPRHLKTFLASVCLAAWILARDPSAKILILSYGQELAEKIAFEIRGILQSEWFQRLFKTRIATNRRKLNDFVTTDGGGVRSVSVEGGVTGLGADVIIVDDPVQIKDSDNLKQLERINDLFDSEVRTRLNDPKKGRIVIVAHRLAENDLPGHVLEEGGWKHVNLPLVANRARLYTTRDGFAWPRQKGELLRPDAFSRGDLERLRRMKRPNFETLQQQNPGARNLRIQAKHFGKFSPGMVPTDLPVVLSVDPGQKGGTANSYSVVQAWGFYQDQFFLLNQWREQSRYSELRSAVRSFIRKHRPSVVLIEATGQGPALQSEIRPMRGMEVVAVTPIDHKVKRLGRHQRLIRSGKLSVPDTAPWVEEFLGEATLFPYAPHDDQIDAMSQFLDWTAGHPTPNKRPPRALISGVSSQGVPLLASRGWGVATMEAPGCVLARKTVFPRYR